MSYRCFISSFLSKFWFSSYLILAAFDILTLLQETDFSWLLRHFPFPDSTKFISFFLSYFSFYPLSEIEGLTPFLSHAQLHLTVSIRVEVPVWPGVLCVCLADVMQGTISLILSLVINRWDTGARLGKSSESQPDVDTLWHFGHKQWISPVTTRGWKVDIIWFNSIALWCFCLLLN